MTRFTIVAIDRERPDAEAIARAARVIHDGGIVAFPTETLYGFAVDPRNAEAVARLVRAKGRAEGKGMPVLIADLDAARAIALRFSPTATRLARAHWPGALTMILDAMPGLPADVAPDGVALRWSSCAAATALARAAGGAITATSANRSGDATPALDPRAIATEFERDIDLLLDAGPLPPSLASTLVDARLGPPRVLRAGPVDISTAMHEGGRLVGMRILHDYAGTAIRLTDERMAHIRDHPEMVGLEDALEQTLLHPLRVVESLSDRGARLYYRFYLGTLVGDKYVCVIVKFSDGGAFVLTAYLTDAIKRGVQIWPIES